VPDPEHRSHPCPFPVHPHCIHRQKRPTHLAEHAGFAPPRASERRIEPLDVEGEAFESLLWHHTIGSSMCKTDTSHLALSKEEEVIGTSPAHLSL
jgi:hypothetical protein